MKQEITPIHATRNKELYIKLITFPQSKVKKSLNKQRHIFQWNSKNQNKPNIMYLVTKKQLSIKISFFNQIAFASETCS